MAPFCFRLESILKYRKYIERRAKIDLFNAKNEVLRKKKEIERLSDERVKIARERNQEGFRGINVARYQIYRSFLQKLDDDLESAHISLKKREATIEEKKAAVKKESIRKKTLETLKDLQFNKHMKQLEREEQKVMDELAIMGRGGTA